MGDPNKGEDSVVVIPEGVTVIDERVFYLDKNVTSVNIPDGIPLKKKRFMPASP